MLSYEYYDKTLYDAYKVIDKKERKGLLSLAERWESTLPLKGKRVLVNCHITLSTLIILDVLKMAGAEVDITATNPLVVHSDALQAINASSSVTYIEPESILENQKPGNYDVLLDCYAGLLNTVLPKHGTVELTHTDAYNAVDLQAPVISADSSDTKNIETFYGTGDAFWRVYKQEYDKDMASQITPYEENIKSAKRIVANSTARSASQPRDVIGSALLNLLSKMPNEGYKNNKFIIFGYGKVGSGIAHNLYNAGVPKQNIIIIDISSTACTCAKLDGYPFLRLNDENKHLITEKIGQAGCIVTATGVKGCISKFFDREDFPKNLQLFNMGTPNEWGDKFAETEIYHNAQPANFALAYPTQVKFLDPIFKTLLLGAEHLVTHPLKPAFHRLPVEIDVNVLTEWQSHHPEYRDMWRHTSDISRYMGKLKINGTRNLPNGPGLFDGPPVKRSQSMTALSGTNGDDITQWRKTI